MGAFISSPSLMGRRTAKRWRGLSRRHVAGDPAGAAACSAKIERAARFASPPPFVVPLPDGGAVLNNPGVVLAAIAAHAERLPPHPSAFGCNLLPKGEKGRLLDGA